MRKYQQLVLLVLSFISVSVLLMYKSENSKLKYVLQVVNFFGRNDTLIALREHNLRNVVVHPMPVFQFIADDFFAYSAFWISNDLVQGGTAQAIVIGKRAGVINFSCSLMYDNGRQIQGKFRFQHLNKDDMTHNTSFQVYIFICHTAKVDSGRPESVQFRSKTSTGYNLVLFHYKTPKTTTDGTICLDLVNTKFSKDMRKTERSVILKQFFLSHYILGFRNIIIYKSDELPNDFLEILERFDITLQMLPFNFPFPQHNGSEGLRSIIKQDCLMRNSKVSKTSILLEADEFLYMKNRLNDENSVHRLITEKYTKESNFKLQTFAVCMNNDKHLLIDNNLYDPEVKTLHPIKLYRTQYQLSNGMDGVAYESANLPVSAAFVHKYVNCKHVGKDGLHDWRNVLMEDFMQFLQELRRELKV